VAEVVFDYSSYPGKLGLIENLLGQSGWLRLIKLSVSALETEDHVLFLGVHEDGRPLDRDTCAKLLAVSGAVAGECHIPDIIVGTLDEHLMAEYHHVLNEAMVRNQRYFEAEMHKLDLWSEDLKENLEFEIKELARQINDAKRELHKVADLPAKLACHKKVKELEKLRHDKRKTLFDAQDKIDADKDRLIGEIEAQLEQKTADEEIFTIQWKVV
jgi:hypothetical protein